MQTSLLQRLAVAFIGILLATSCGPSATPSAPSTAAALDLTSTAFADGASIPTKYTCDGNDASPPLSWSDPPEGTVSFALIVDDPDAPLRVWVHWVAYDIAADTRSLPENLPGQEQLPGGGLQGSNSWDNLGYGGPCPPPGSTHTYHFKLYALDTTVDLEPGATKRTVTNAMDGHVLAEGRLTGDYAR